MNVVCNSNVLGVGERTTNLFNIDATTIVQINSQGSVRCGVSIGSALAGTYTLSFTNTGAYTIYVTTRTGTTYSQSGAITVSPHTITLANNVDELIVRTTSPDMVTWERLGFTNIMLVEGSTAPTTFVPFGYEIPLTVNSSTQDIYIGSEPLTAGQSISKTSTSTDIALLSGTNTISTSLNNKPNMFISYQSGELGVGVSTENLYNPNATDVNNGYESHMLLKSGGATAANDNYAVSEYIQVSANQSYALKWYAQNPSSATNASMVFYDSSKTFISGTSYNANAVVIVTSPSNASYVRISTHNNYRNNTMLVKGNTAPEAFIPYGYKVPIRIYDGETNTENTNYTDLNLYIGNSLLSADEYIDFINNKIYKYVSSVLTPTNPIVDLPVIPTNGTNTIDTTLYNKPEMYIKYSTDSFSRIFTTTLPTTFINHSDKVKDWIIYGNGFGNK